MEAGAPNVSVIGIDRAGSGFVPSAYNNVGQGLYDPERTDHEELKLRNGHGARDVSPTRAQQASASAGKEPVAAKQQVVAEMFTRTCHAIVLDRAQDGVTVIAHDDPEVVKPPLLEMRGQLLQQRLVSLHPWPAGNGRSHAKNGCLMLDFAGAPLPLTAIGHYGPKSPFAQKNSPHRQEVFVVATHNALCTAPRSNPKNPTIGGVYERLGDWGPCYQYGFSSIPIALGRERRFWSSLKRVGGGPFTPGYGDLDSTLKVANRATVLAHEPAALTTTEPFDAEAPHYVLYVVPFSPRDPGFQEFIERQSVWLAEHFAAAEGIFVSGNGVPLLDGEGERFLQVSVLAPLAGPARKRG